MKFRVLIVFLGIFLSQLLYAGELMPYVYLTFEEEDTSSSITINFMTEGKSETSYAYISEEPQEGLGFLFSEKVQSRIGHIKKVDKSYHHVKLENLEPSKIYYFTVGDSEIGFSKQYKFKTLTNENEPIKLMNGGDMGTNQRIVDTSLFAISQSPDVILIGGDIAYADAKPKKEKKWIEWFEKMNQVMFTNDGFLIPLIVAIGNHETTTGIPFLSKAPFYFELFPQSRRSYFTRKLGANTALLVLDSGHYKLHSKQKDFIEENLKRFQDIPHRLALYHAPLYPNNRGPEDHFASEGRKHWLSLFDEFHLTAAFEHHDHTFKRTHILRDNKVSPRGTLYVGDGCWGKNGRESKERWYLAKGSSATHVWSATLEEGFIEFMASGQEGEIYDHFRLYNIQDDKTEIEELL